MHTLIVVENNSVPFDRRVWYEATTLRDEGWQVSVICPGDKKAPTNGRMPEYLDGIAIYRFHVEFAQGGIVGFLKEYLTAFFAIARLSRRVWREKRFEIIHISNPPDIFFPIGLLYHFLGAKYIYDHHDLFPEMISERFKGKVGKIFFRLACWLEILTYKSADLVIPDKTYHIWESFL